MPANLIPPTLCVQSPKDEPFPHFLLHKSTYGHAVCVMSTWLPHNYFWPINRVLQWTCTFVWITYTSPPLSLCPNRLTSSSIHPGAFLAASDFVVKPSFLPSIGKTPALNGNKSRGRKEKKLYVRDSREITSKSLKLETIFVPSPGQSYANGHVMCVSMTRKWWHFCCWQISNNGKCTSFKQFCKCTEK